MDKYENSRNYHVNIHSFRAYTRTIGGKFTTQDFIEDLIGHSGYLKQYVRIDESEKINYYRKLEPHLRILN